MISNYKEYIPFPLCNFIGFTYSVSKLILFTCFGYFTWTIFSLIILNSISNLPPIRGCYFYTLPYIPNMIHTHMLLTFLISHLPKFLKMVGFWCGFKYHALQGYLYLSLQSCNWTQCSVVLNHAVVKDGYRK